MKIVCFVFLLFAIAARQCRADLEFGRVAIGDTLDEEDALLKELMYSSYDMSMSMSMSYSYDYSSNDEDSTPSPSTAGSSSPDASPSEPVGPTSAPFDGNATDPGDSVTASPTPAPTLPSCFGLPIQDSQSPLFLETSKDSVAFAVVENTLDDKMRAVLPFCEDLGQRKLEAGEDSGSNYYIGNVNLVGDEMGATCQSLLEGKNCFVAELNLRLFGNATDDDVAYIVGVVQGLLEGGEVDEALGADENALIDDLNNDNTASDQDAGDPQAANKSQEGLHAGQKVMIVFLAIGAVAFVGVFAWYRRASKPTTHDIDGTEKDENDESNPRILVKAEDRDHMYGA